MTNDAPRFGPPDDYEPPPAQPFTLHGKRLSDGEPWEETFSVLGEAPQGALVDLAVGVSIKDGNITYSATATVRFLTAVIVPLDEARFAQLIADKDRPMPLDQLGAVMLWAAGIVAGRPTGPQPPSPDGLRGDDAGSEDAPGGEAATPAA